MVRVPSAGRGAPQEQVLVVSAARRRQVIMIHDASGHDEHGLTLVCTVGCAGSVAPMLFKFIVMLGYFTPPITVSSRGSSRPGSGVTVDPLTHWRSQGFDGTLLRTFPAVRP